MPCRPKVTRAKWTDAGIRNVKDSPKRRQAFEDRITAMGRKVKTPTSCWGSTTSWS